METWGPGNRAPLGGALPAPVGLANVVRGPGDYRQNPWFVNFLVRILQGSPEVLGLLKINPFPEGPPRYVRAEAYDYHFTNYSEKARTGNWWKREYKGAYIHTISLKGLQGH